MTDPTILKFLAEIGSRGGQTRAKNLSAKRRKAIATEASKAAAIARKRRAKAKKPGVGE